MSIIKNGIHLDYKEVTSGNGDANSSDDSVFAQRGQLEPASQIVLVGRGFSRDIRGPKNKGFSR